MCIEPAGKSGEHRRINEHNELGPRRIDAEGFRRDGATTQGADGAADAAVEQIVRRDKRQQDRDPHDDEIFARINDRVRADA